MPANQFTVLGHCVLVVTQLLKFLEKSDYLGLFPSHFRLGFGTEIVLLWMIHTPRAVHKQWVPISLDGPLRAQS